MYGRGVTARTKHQESGPEKKGRSLHQYIDPYSRRRHPAGGAALYRHGSKGVPRLSAPHQHAPPADAEIRLGLRGDVLHSTGGGCVREWNICIAYMYTTADVQPLSQKAENLSSRQFAYLEDITMTFGAMCDDGFVK